MSENLDNLDRIWQAFGPDDLRRVCTMDETDFAAAYGMTTIEVNQPAPDNFFAFLDRGASVLAVAHLDTVGSAARRTCTFAETADGTVVYSTALDDRLGAYIILDMLPRLGVNVDVLLTTGEESGCSTAAFFAAPKQYDWIIEFDRGGTDVVLYQYDDVETRQLVKDTGARVSEGIFSDICYLEHLGVKAFNWGVGYQDYHSRRSHAFLDDTFEMLDYFLDFYADNAGTRLVHEKQESYGRGFRSYGGGWGNVTSGSSSADGWTAADEDDEAQADWDDRAYDAWVKEQEDAGMRAWLADHA